MATTCPTCGADVRDDATACEVCGSGVAATPPPAGDPAATGDLGAAGEAADRTAGDAPGPGDAPGARGEPGAPRAGGAAAGGPPPPPPPASGAGGAWGPPPAPVAHPSGLSSETRNWGMAAHLSSFIGVMLAGIASFVGPLVIWLVKRDEHPFIAHHAKEALNFNLSILLYGIVSGILMLLLIGFPMLIAVGVIYLIFTVIAAVKAANGEGYRYPLTIRFIS